MFSSFVQCFSLKAKKESKDNSFDDIDLHSAASDDAPSTLAPSLPEKSVDSHNVVNEQQDLMHRMLKLADERRFAGQHVRVGRKLIQHTLASHTDNRMSDEDTVRV